jgi:hypothetical protein
VHSRTNQTCREFVAEGIAFEWFESFRAVSAGQSTRTTSPHNRQPRAAIPKALDFRMSVSCLHRIT